MGDYVEWSWQPPVGITGVTYKVEQVADSSSTQAIGFTSGDPTAYGIYRYQFNKPGLYYYWSGYVESSGQISFRGLIDVKDTLDRELEINLKLNGFKAQKCAFPFNYKSDNYTSCIQNDLNYNWCSPSLLFSGQKIHCDVISNTEIIIKS